MVVVASGVRDLRVEVLQLPLAVLCEEPVEYFLLVFPISQVRHFLTHAMPHFGAVATYSRLISATLSSSSENICQSERSWRRS